MAPKTLTQIAELDVVELRRPAGEHDEGALGTVVSVAPDGSKLTVEFEDAEGEVDLVTVDRLDLDLIDRARAS